MRLCANEVHTPFCKEICGVSSWINGVKTVPHVIYIMSAVRVVVIHHITEKTVEMIESAFTWMIFRFESEMPFANKGSAVIFLF